ncbi:MAG: class I SAM-dependent methyltransferase [Roseinatronobacter sp.]
MIATSQIFHDPAPRAERLDAAFAAGFTLPAGEMAIYRPRAGEDFSPLPRARVTMVQGFRPDHDALAQAGWTVATAALPAENALICLPRAKAEALALIAAAAAQGARLILVDGQKTDGVEAVLKKVRTRAAVTEVISKAHGKLFWFDAAGADFSDWTAHPRLLTDPVFGDFETLPGVFSADGIDPASQYLAQHLPAKLPPVMGDFGAGWGYLSAAVLARAGVTRLHLLEAEVTALDLARRNIHDPRAQFHWTDATCTAPPEALDGIVMNPPFHSGRAAQPALGLAFIAAAASALSMRGALWMVANRHLPYQPALEQHFSRTEILAETHAFRLWHAQAPRRTGRSQTQGKTPAPRQRRTGART